MLESTDRRLVRDAREGDIDRLATIWYEGWQDAHTKILPSALARFRTLESFRARLSNLLPRVRMAGSVSEPAGFCITKDDELYQLYVSQQARGGGVAAALVADAERRMAERGISVAWLTCAIGNERAARFYEKHGWRRAGIVVSELETPEGVFPLEVWRYEKQLRCDPPDGA